MRTQTHHNVHDVTVHAKFHGSTCWLDIPLREGPDVEEIVYVFFADPEQIDLLIEELRARRDEWVRARRGPLMAATA